MAAQRGPRCRRQASTIATRLPTNDRPSMTRAARIQYCMARMPWLPSPGEPKLAAKASPPNRRDAHASPDSPSAIRPQGQPRADALVFIKEDRRTGRPATATAG
ncbi:hypothetical protein G6F32_016524 [Rhizopus arrhizus]|nr:hypothetical protein G6F32_016524 [Rhizopus arrhizus]